MNGRYCFSALCASGLVVSGKALKEVPPPPALHSIQGFQGLRICACSLHTLNRRPCLSCTLRRPRLATPGPVWQEEHTTCVRAPPDMQAGEAHWVFRVLDRLCASTRFVPLDP